MGFLDELADCEACPTPHNICEFSGCAICRECPAAIERRRQLAAEREAYAQQTFQARNRWR